MDDTGQRIERALATVKAFWAAYEAASPVLVELFTEDASIFTSSGSPRQQGREAHQAFLRSRTHDPASALQVLHTEVRLVGDGALVTSHNRIRADYRSVDHRTTLLLVPNGEALKVAHLHISPLSTPSAVEASTRGLVEEVVRER